MEKNDPHNMLRQELKYALGRGEYAAIRQRCRAVMRADPHVGADGTYHIRSLYFDDLGDTALMQNYSGVSQREKFRIRLYNGDPSTLHLEKKVKYGGLGRKYACSLMPEELQKLLDGDLSWMLDESRPLLKELRVRMKTDLLRPKTIVAYQREPYVYGPGNVRVTFDYDIRSGVCRTDLLNPDVPLIPVNPDRVLMEVKYDAFLPDIIRMALQEGTPRVGAFSKYAACRQYDM